MKSFVVFSDLHLHQWNYGSTLINGRNSRLEQQKDAVKRLVTYCKEKEITEAIFCGDFFHTSTITAEVSQAAHYLFELFRLARISLRVIPGNHDQQDKSGVFDALAGAGTSYRGFANGTRSETLFRSHSKGDNLPVCFLPFIHEKERLSEALRSANNQGGLIFMHQGVSGVEVNSKGFTLNEALTVDMIPDSCVMAFTGHYHSCKQVSDKLIIPGSMMQLNWGDEGEERGWLEVVVDGGNVVDVTLVPSGAPKFITVNENDFNQTDKLPDLSSNFVRVLSVGNYSPEELSEAARSRGAASVEVKREAKDTTPVKIEAKSLLSFNEFVVQYAKAKCHAGVISEYDQEIGERLLRGSYQIPQV